jgi:hypothetical protein
MNFNDKWIIIGYFILFLDLISHIAYLAYINSLLNSLIQSIYILYQHNNNDNLE